MDLGQRPPKRFRLFILTAQGYSGHPLDGQAAVRGDFSR